MLTEKEWETFFELLDKIINSDGPWQEKVETVNKKAEQFSAEMELEEFLALLE